MAQPDYKKLMRERFADLSEQRKNITAANAPLREELRGLRRELATKEQELIERIKAASGPLDDIDKELNGISRALMGKTGLNMEG